MQVTQVSPSMKRQTVLCCIKGAKGGERVCNSKTALEESQLSYRTTEGGGGGGGMQNDY